MAVRARKSTVRKSEPSVTGYGDVGLSLLFIFPLFLIYSVGILFVPATNGVDFVSRNLYVALGHSQWRYLALHGVLAVAFLGVVAKMKRSSSSQAGRGRTAGAQFLPMLLESSIYALTLGSFIVFVMQNVFGFGGLAVSSQVPAATAQPSVAARAILSLGAGVYEELVFRLALFSGGAALLHALFKSFRTAIVVSLVLSSALFAAAHHIGAAGDPWTLQIFVYRLLAGIVFGVIYYYRSLAHAVYAHAIYDLYVLLIRS